MVNRKVKFKPEVFRTQLESVRALRRELAIKEKELADQKWVFEQFLQSPTWRFTYPVRWAANQLRRFGEIFASGSRNSTDVLTEMEPTEDDYPDVELDSGFSLKSSYDYQFRIWLESFLVSGSRLEVPHSENPTISILLVLFNRSELTFACLRSISECRSEAIEVIIVDNASTDDTSKLLDRVCGVRVIRNSTNLHFLLAANQAAKEAKGDYILLLNNDAQLLPGTIRSALRTLTSATDIGAVGGKIVLLDGTLQEAGSIVWQDGSCHGYGRGDDPLAPEYMFRRDVDYCSGAFLLTPRRLWEQLGGFDVAFRPAYYEEADYCMRLRAQGFRVVYEPDAVISHYEFGSSKSASKAISLQAEHQHIFVEHHREALKMQSSNSAGNALKARSRNTNDRILFLDDRVPHSWLGSGFPRARTLILSLIKQGFFVSVYPIAEMSESWELVYADLPREIEVITGLGSKMLEMFLRGRRDYYKCIVVSRPHNMKILHSMMQAHPDWFDNIRVIYDAEALFAPRDAMQQKLIGTPSSDREVRRELKREIALAAAAHCVISVSAMESALFTENGVRNVHVIGHSIDPDPQHTPFERRSGLLFVGAIHSESSPNADSLIWFLNEVFPKIRQKLGDAIRLTVAGVNKSSRVQKLASSSVHIAGHVPDLGDLYANARLFIAPTRIAAGLPHKIHEAAARGLPVVATPLLAGQLGWTERELAIAADAETFASRCCELYTNPDQWLSKRNAALDRVRTECSPDSFDKSVGDVLHAAGLKLDRR
jgi:GT2 family glycosyltransferase/glycosyltransferase involved in cell wall biosynthesis